MCFSKGFSKLSHIFQDHHNFPDFITARTQLLKQLVISLHITYVHAYMCINLHTGTYFPLQVCILYMEEVCVHTHLG